MSILPPQSHFYGRRQGRKIRPFGAQLMEDVLPALSLDLTNLSENKDLRDLFPTPVTTVWCEIGFGGGEHLAHQLIENPLIGVIGCEPFKNGVAHFLKILPLEHRSRVRIFSEDVRLLLPLLPIQSLARFYILFPDPWPKKRHRKRRLVSKPLLDQIARLLQGEVRLASDDPDYIEAMFLALSTHPRFEWVGGVADPSPEIWPSWPSSWLLTRYGAKAQKQGRACAHLIFRTKREES